ncbi:MAG: TetR/AcrR family transcriptional regulator [Chloroflexota bacterium]
MPRFSEREKEAIRDKIIETAMICFTTAGIRKTSFEDLTRPAGIPKSSFYIFFESKEALYLELLFAEVPKAWQRVQSAYEQAETESEKIEILLKTSIEAVQETPLSRRLMTHPEDLQYLTNRLRPEDLIRQEQEARLPLIQLVAQAQKEGVFIDEQPEVIAGVLRGITMLMLHKDDIGKEYPEVLELTIKLIAKGLASTKDQQ